MFSKGIHLKSCSEGSAWVLILAVVSLCCAWGRGGEPRRPEGPRGDVAAVCSRVGGLARGSHGWGCEEGVKRVRAQRPAFR